MPNVGAGDDEGPPSAAIRPSPSHPRSDVASPVNSLNAPLSSANLAQQPTTWTQNDDPSMRKEGEASASGGMNTDSAETAQKDEGSGSPSVGLSEPSTVFRVIRVTENQVSITEVPPTSEELPPLPEKAQSEAELSIAKVEPQKEEEEEEMDIQEEEEETPPPVPSPQPPLLPQAVPRTPPPPSPTPTPSFQDPIQVELVLSPPTAPPLPRSPTPASATSPITESAEPKLKPIPTPPWASDGFRPPKSPPPGTRGRGRGSGRGRARGTVGRAIGERTGAGRGMANANGSAIERRQTRSGQTAQVPSGIPLAPPVPPTNHYPNARTYPVQEPQRNMTLDPKPYSASSMPGTNNYAPLQQVQRAREEPRAVSDDARGPVQWATPTTTAVPQIQQQQRSQSPVRSGAPLIQQPVPPRYVYGTPAALTPYPHAPYNLSQPQLQPYPTFQPQSIPPPSAPVVLSAPLHPARTAVAAASTYAPTSSSSRKRTRSQSPLPEPPPPPPWYTPAQAETHRRVDAQAFAHAQSLSSAPARGSMSRAVGPLASRGLKSASVPVWATATGMKRLKISRDLLSPSPSPSPALRGYVRRMSRSQSRSISRSPSMGRGRSRSQSSRSRSRDGSRLLRRWSRSSGRSRSRNLSRSEDGRNRQHQASGSSAPQVPPRTVAWGRRGRSGSEMDVDGEENTGANRWSRQEKGKGRERDPDTRGRSASPMLIDPQHRARPDAHWITTGRLPDPSPTSSLPVWASSGGTRVPQISSSANLTATATLVPPSPPSATSQQYHYDYAIEHSPPMSVHAPSHANSDSDSSEGGRMRDRGYSQSKPPPPPLQGSAQTSLGLRASGPLLHVIRRSHSTSPTPPERTMRNMYIAQASIGMGAQTYAYLATQPQPPPREPAASPPLAPTLIVVQEEGRKMPPTARPGRRPVASRAKEQPPTNAGSQRPKKRAASPRKTQAESNVNGRAVGGYPMPEVLMQYNRPQHQQLQGRPEQPSFHQQQQYQYQHSVPLLPPRYIPMHDEMYRNYQQGAKTEDAHRQQQQQRPPEETAPAHSREMRPRPLPAQRSRPPQPMHRVIIPAPNTGPSSDLGSSGSALVIPSSSPPSQARARALLSVQPLTRTHPVPHTQYQQSVPLTPPPPAKQNSRTPAAKVRLRKNGMPKTDDDDRPNRIVSMRALPQPPPQVVAQQLAAQLGIPMGSTGLQGTITATTANVTEMDVDASERDSGSPAESGSGAEKTTAMHLHGLETIVLPEYSAVDLPQKMPKGKHRKTASAQSAGDGAASLRKHRRATSGPDISSTAIEQQMEGPLQHFQTTLFPQEHLLFDMHSVGGAQFVLKPPRNVKGSRGVYGTLNDADGGERASGSGRQSGAVASGTNGTEAYGDRIPNGNAEPSEENETPDHAPIGQRRRSVGNGSTRATAVGTCHVVGGRLMTPPPNETYAGQVHANAVAAAAASAAIAQAAREGRGKARGRPKGVPNGGVKGKEREIGQGSRRISSAQAPLIVSDDEPPINASVRVIRGPGGSPDAPPIQVHLEDSPSNTGPIDDSDSEEQDELESEDSDEDMRYQPLRYPQITSSSQLYPSNSVAQLRQSTRTSSAPSTSRSSSHPPAGQGTDGDGDASMDSAGKKSGLRNNRRIVHTQELDDRSPTKGNIFARSSRPSRKSKQYTCDICDQVFTRSGDVRRHKDTRHKLDESGGCRCPFCGRVLTRQDALQRHWDRYCRKKSQRHLDRSRAGMASGMGVYGLMHRSYLDPQPHDSSLVPDNEEIRAAMVMATAMVQTVSAGGLAGPSTAPSNGSYSHRSIRSAYDTRFLREEEEEEEDDEDEDDDEEDEDEDEGSDQMDADISGRFAGPSRFQTHRQYGERN